MTLRRGHDDFEKSSWWLWGEDIMTLKTDHGDFEERTWRLWREDMFTLKRRHDDFGESTWWLWGEDMMTLGRGHDDFENRSLWLWKQIMMTLTRVHDHFDESSWWLWREFMTLTRVHGDFAKPSWLHSYSEYCLLSQRIVTDTRSKLLICWVYYTHWLCLQTKKNDISNCRSPLKKNIPVEIKFYFTSSYMIPHDLFYIKNKYIQIASLHVRIRFDL